MAASAELAILFTAKGDLQQKVTALNAQMKDLRKAIDLAVDSGDSAEVQRLSAAFAETGAELTRVRSGLKATNAEIKRTASEGTAATSRLRTAWNGLKRIMASPLIPMVTITGMVYFGKRAMTAFAEAEKSQMQLQVAMAKFPRLSDVTAESFANLNTELMNMTGADDDALAAAEAILARFKMTGTEVQALIPLVNDFAIATGRDVPEAAESVGKALMGNARAMKSLGIDFVRTGDHAKDLDTIMGALDRKVGGVGEAFGTTTAGKLAIAQENFENLQEEIGSGLVPALEALVSIVRPIAEWFAGLSDGAKKTAVAMAIVGGAALALGPRLLMLRTEMALLQTTTAGATTTSGAFAASLGSIAGALGIVAAAWAGTQLAVAGIKALFPDYYNPQFEDMAGGLMLLADGADAAGAGFSDLGDRIASVNGANGKIQGMAKNMLFLGGVVMTQADKDRAAFAALDQQLMQMDPEGAAMAYQALADSLQGTGIAVSELDALLPGYTTAIGGSAAATEGASSAAREATRATEAWAVSMERINGLLSMESALQNYKSAIKTYIEEPTNAAALGAVQSMMTVADSMKNPAQRAKFMAKGLSEVEDAAKSSGMKLSPGMKASIEAAWDEVRKLRAELAAVDALNPTVDVTIRVNGQNRYFGGADLYAATGIAGTKAGGLIRGMRTGGIVTGAGTDTSDTAGAFALSAGEYVVRAKAVRALGLPTLDRINRADKMIDPTLLGRVELRERREERVTGPLIGSITVNNPGSDVDVERAVSTALSRAERRRRERS